LFGHTLSTAACIVLAVIFLALAVTAFGQPD